MSERIFWSGSYKEVHLRVGAYRTESRAFPGPFFDVQPEPEQYFLEINGQDGYTRDAFGSKTITSDEEAVAIAQKYIDDIEAAGS